MNFLRNSKGAPLYMESSNCQSTIFLRIVFNLIFPTYNLDAKKLSKQGKGTFCLFMYQYTTAEVYQEVNESFCIIRSSFLMCLYIYIYIYLIGIHSIQDWITTTRHGITRKEAQKAFLTIPVSVKIRVTSRKVNQLSKVIWDRKIITEFTRSII